MKTRMAIESDRAALVALGVRAYREARYGRYPLNCEKLISLFDLTQKSNSPFFIVVLLDDSDVAIGMLIGLVTEHFFAEMAYATNLVLYVAPEKRGLHGAVRLIRAFEQEAIARGAEEILIGAASNIDAARTIELYHKLGYQPVGANSVKYIGE